MRRKHLVIIFIVLVLVALFGISRFVPLSNGYYLEPDAVGPGGISNAMCYGVGLDNKPIIVVHHDYRILEGGLSRYNKDRSSLASISPYDDSTCGKRDNLRLYLW